MCDLNTIEESHLIAIKGIAPITAHAFNQGITSFREIESVVPVSYVRRRSKSMTDEQINVVFSGFRDKELEKELTDRGWNVTSSVSKNTTYLVVKDLTSSTSKIQKAKSLGTKVIEIEEFCKMILQKS